MDEDLYAAVAVKAAERGETVTDLIIRRFEAYIRDDEAAGIVSAVPVAESPVYTVPDTSASYEDPREVPPCRHPVEAVDGSWCRNCGADVW